MRYLLATWLALTMLLLVRVAGEGAPVYARQRVGVASTAMLRVGGDVTSPSTLTPEAVKAMPRTKVEVTENGRTVVYEGVLVGELLKRAGVPLGPDLKGDALATYVLASAADGYRVVFSIGELNPALGRSDVIVADTVDGKPLAAQQGPFRIVAPKDGRPARAVRMLERLEVVYVRQ